MSDNIESITDPNLKQKISILSRIGGFIKKHPVFFIALAFWVVIWILFVDVFALYSIILIPAWGIALILSLSVVSYTRWKFIPIITWSSMLSLILLFFVTWAISYPLSQTTNYYLAIEMGTPSGVITNKSMVQSTAFSLPTFLNQFNFRQSKIRGEAVFCELNDGKNIIATLSFASDMYGKRTLRELPWIAAGLQRRDKNGWPVFLKGQFELKNKLIPILVSFSDINNPQSITKVDPNRVSDVVGSGYVINNIWVEMTEDEYRNFGIRGHINWVDSIDGNGVRAVKNAFTQIGFPGVSHPFAL